jgi:hypothetical protein
VGPKAPRIDLNRHPPPATVARLLTGPFCEHHGIVPVAVEGGALVVACARTERLGSLRAELRLFTGLDLEVVQADPATIERVRKALYGDPS